MDTRGSAGRDGSWPLWIALALAFSPVLRDLARHLAEEPWARYALLFPFLFVRCVRREERVQPSAIGSWLVAAGLAIELAAAFAGAIRWARPAVALAAIGMCARQGIGSWRSRALLLFAIPMPAFLVKLGERSVASAMGEPVVSLLGFAGADHLLSGSAIISNGATLVMMNREWLSLAPLLAGLAWYHAVASRRTLSATLVITAFFAALTLPFQWAGLCVGIAIAALGAPDLAQAWIDHGVAFSVAIGGLLVSERHLRRSDA